MTGESGDGEGVYIGAKGQTGRALWNYEVSYREVAAAVGRMVIGRDV